MCVCVYFLAVLEAEMEIERKKCKRKERYCTRLRAVTFAKKESVSGVSFFSFQIDFRFVLPFPHIPAHTHAHTLTRLATPKHLIHSYVLKLLLVFLFLNLLLCCLFCCCLFVCLWQSLLALLLSLTHRYTFHIHSSIH